MLRSVLSSLRACTDHSSHSHLPLLLSNYRTPPLRFQLLSRTRCSYAMLCSHSRFQRSDSRGESGLRAGGEVRGGGRGEEEEGGGGGLVTRSMRLDDFLVFFLRGC